MQATLSDPGPDSAWSEETRLFALSSRDVATVSPVPESPPRADYFVGTLTDVQLAPGHLVTVTVPTANVAADTGSDEHTVAFDGMVFETAHLNSRQVITLTSTTAPTLTTSPTPDHEE